MSKTDKEELQITPENLEELKFNDQGLIPAIVQDVENGEVLMMAWMNLDSLKETIKVGKTCFWSRSRQKYWIKGESSGHTQTVHEIRYDCDMDVLLIKATQKGAACHTFERTCFYRKIDY